MPEKTHNASAVSPVRRVARVLSLVTVFKRLCRLRQCLLGVITVIMSGVVVGATTPDENLVKAAFLYNFAQFVEWPEGESNGSVTLCVFAPEPVAAAFLSLSGKTVKGRELLTRFLDPADALDECQLLFVSEREPINASDVIQLTAGRHILTVSDRRNFARDGGVIGLVKRRSKIRFEVNLEAARLAQLKISSQLLKLARIVKP